MPRMIRFHQPASWTSNILNWLGAASLLLLSAILIGCGSTGAGGNGTGGSSGVPALAANIATQGNFSSGQQNATYNINVSNNGTAATSGTVTVVDPPTGFTITAIAGTGWTCTLSTATCTRSDALPVGQTFPPITVTGNVTASNGTPVNIPLNLSGGGLSSPVNSAPSVTVAAPALSITKTHTGNFNLGQQGGSYTVTVSNGASAGATNAKVTVTETVPAGESLVSMSGSGWTCPGSGGANTCDRSDALATNASYPAITVVVNVSSTAASPQVNQVSVSGGGISSSVSNTDSTTINLPDLSIVKSHSAGFTAGTNGTFNLAVTNGASGGPAAGTITVTDTLDSHFTFISGTASGWNCGAVGQVVTCTNPGPLASGASAATIPLVVAINSSASGTISNTATVATFGDSNAANNSSTDSVTVAQPPPDLSITKSHTGNFTGGTTGTFNIAVSNVGSGPTTGTITVTDTLASAFTFVSGSATGWNCNASGQAVTCTNPGPINAGSSAATIPLVVSVGSSASGSISNTAAVATAGDANAANNSSTDNVTVTAAPDFSISLSQSPVNTPAGTTSSAITVSIGALNGFTGSVSVNVTGLPSGFSCSPACPLTISANSSSPVSFVVPANAVLGNLSLQVQGTSGSLSHSKPLTLDVTTSLQGFWNFWQNEALVSQNQATVSGKIFVSGWGFEKIPVTSIGILVDGTSIGNAFYGLPRPDVMSGLPGAPEDIGFSLGLDTTTLTNGLHTVSVNVIDSVSNVSPMLNYPNNVAAMQITVNNSAPAATGPVVNLTLHASTTSLTVGTVVQYTASATDGSGNAVTPSFAWSSSAPAIVKVNPAGDLFPLAAGTATISVSAGGKTQQVGVTVAASTGAPGTISVSYGPPEVVFNYVRDACHEGDVPDNPARAVRLNDGSILLVAAGNPIYFAELGADFNSLKRNCANPILVSTDGTTPSTFLNRQWIFSLYNDGSKIHALIHNEFHDPVATTCKPGDTTDGNPCQYNSVTYAYSTDSGQTFQTPASPLNVIAPPPMQWTPPAQTGSLYWGYQEPTNIVHNTDGYYYARFGGFTPPPNVTGINCVMRTTNLLDPSSWRAWNGASFQLQMTDPYTNAASSFCANSPSNVTVPYESLTYNTYLNMFVLLGLDSDFGPSGPTNCGFHFSLSSDLLNWTAQQLIAPAYVPAPSACRNPAAGGGLAGSFAYGSVIDPDDPSTNFETPGRTMYVYFTRFNDNMESRDLVRVAVMVTKY